MNQMGMVQVHCDYPKPINHLLNKNAKMDGSSDKHCVCEKRADPSGRSI